MQSLGDGNWRNLSCTRCGKSVWSTNVQAVCESCLEEDQVTKENRSREKTLNREYSQKEYMLVYDPTGDFKTGMRVDIEEIVPSVFTEGTIFRKKAQYLVHIFNGRLSFYGNKIEDALAGIPYKPNKVDHKNVFCRQGHEFTEDNTVYIAGVRRCKICRKAYTERITNESNSQKQRGRDSLPLRP